METHVSDFTYGQDKAVVTSTAGPLDITQLQVTPEGTISYTGAGNTGGSLNVAGQGYGGFYAASLTDANGKNNVNVGWTGEDGGMIDASSLTDKVLLLGNSTGAKDSLIGGKSRDTIIAGSGDSSLWGGAGRDLIESNGEASHTIFFLAGDGNDTVTGFTAYGEDNADTMDFLGQGVTQVKHTSQGIQIYHGSDKMILTGNYDANTMIKWENGDDHGIAKIGMTGEDNRFSYHEDVTSYLGSSGKDTITVGGDVDKAEIWLDGSHGANYNSVEILDASNTNGTAILAGGAGQQPLIIYGRAGEFTLSDGTTWAADYSTKTWNRVK